MAVGLVADGTSWKTGLRFPPGPEQPEHRLNLGVRLGRRWGCRGDRQPPRCQPVTAYTCELLGGGHLRPGGAKPVDKHKRPAAFCQTATITTEQADL